MKMSRGIFSAGIVLAVLFLAGTVTAATTNNPVVGAEHFVPRPSDDLNAPAPVPGTGNWTGNWSGNWDGECDGLFSPDSPFYGLKLGFEDLDESFTLNETERIEKRIRHGDNRLFELLCEMDRNETRNFDRILDRYWEKMNQTEDSLQPYASNGTGLLHAREMIEKHQWVLQNLSEQKPDNKGLARAYNNSLKLESKFTEKIRMRYNLPADGNVTMSQDQNQNGKGGKATLTDKVPPGQQKQQDKAGSQDSDTTPAQSQDAGTSNGQKDENDQKDKNDNTQGSGNSQKDKNDQKQNNGNGRNK